MNKQSWTTPEMTSYGSAAKITQQNNVNFNKNIGSGDSIVLIVNGVSSNVPVPGSTLQNITVNGSLVS